MNLKNNRIGVWGVGVGGRAIVDFLAENNYEMNLFDAKGLDAQLFPSFTHIIDSLDTFLTTSDVIIPSAGIDLRSYNHYAHKFVAELDLFQRYFKKPIIAVTGTLGKTTITTVLGQILERAGYRVLVGGNIGVGLCSLIKQQDSCDYALLEVSSFQLELCKTFAPHVAVWTNFYPNHLDRHTTLEEYFEAKAKILQCQRENDYALLPASLVDSLCPRIKSIVHVISSEMPVAWHSISAHQTVGLEENWRVILAALEILRIDLKYAMEPVKSTLEHRMEYVREVSGVTFINDSKSTVSQATVAAVNKLYPNRIILLLGGLSKGVSRDTLLSQLRGKVEKIICFGAESHDILKLANSNNIACESVDSFASLIEKSYTNSKPGDYILLSPGGSSFDMFKNYQERGTVFKKMVSRLREGST